MSFKTTLNYSPNFNSKKKAKKTIKIHNCTLHRDEK